MKSAFSECSLQPAAVQAHNVPDNVQTGALLTQHACCLDGKPVGETTADYVY